MSYCHVYPSACMLYTLVRHTIMKHYKFIKVNDILLIMLVDNTV